VVVTNYKCGKYYHDAICGLFVCQMCRTGIDAVVSRIRMFSIRMAARNWLNKRCFAILLAFVIVFGVFYCEFFIYYKYLWKCDWPEMNAKNSNESVLRVLILSDPHLLGPRTGHWLDKLRR
jgi:hypothetical protein